MTDSTRWILMKVKPTWTYTDTTGRSHETYPNSETSPLEDEELVEKIAGYITNKDHPMDVARVIIRELSGKE